MTKYQRYLLLIAASVSSATGLAAELLLGTLATYLVGNQALAYGVAVGVFLAAMGIGSYLTQFITPSGSPSQQQKALLIRFVQIELLIAPLTAILPLALSILIKISRNVNFRLILVLIFGIVLSCFSGYFFYKTEEKTIIREFQQDVDERAASLSRELAINFETLSSLSILFHEGQIPNLERFQLEAEKILNRHSNIQALEWIPRVFDSQRAMYESQLRTYFPDFEITQLDKQGFMTRVEQKEEYYPVYYIEPVRGNEAALGFDLSSNPVRLKALEKSRDTAQPQATGSIKLVQKNDNQKGFLIFLPIYKGNPSTLVKRRENLEGFILGVYRIGDIFMSSSFSDRHMNIKMELVDETSISQPEILYSNQTDTKLKIHDQITYKKELPEIWGRKWTLVACPTLSYLSVRRNILPIVITIAGIVLSFFITLYLYIIAKRTATIEQIVIQKTEELNRANKKLMLISRTDGLTGVANRAFMDEFLEKEWLRAIRNQTFICVP